MTAAKIRGRTLLECARPDDDARIKHYRFHFASSATFNEAVEWCRANRIRWRHRSNALGHQFPNMIYIRNKQRAALFKIFWSEYCTSWEQPAVK